MNLLLFTVIVYEIHMISFSDHVFEMPVLVNGIESKIKILDVNTEVN